MRNDFETGYLAHSAKGTTWKNKKYIAKQPLGNGLYKYFYTQAELDAFLKRKGGAKTPPSSQIPAKNYDKNAPKSTTLTASKENTAAVKNKLAAKNTTTNANKKTASEVTLSETKDKQAVGKAAADKLLNKSSSDSSTKKKGSGGKSSSKDATKSIGKGKGKSGSSSGSKKSGSGSSKEKSGSKATKEKAEKASTKKKQSQNDEAEKIDPITIDSLNKAYKDQGSEMNSFNGSSSEFKRYLLDKYDDGAFGYLSAGSKVYKFVIEDGDVILKDYGSNREVSFDSYLKSVKSYKEFQANKKKN